ncbi:hypothetical protein BDR04DRAFT_1092622 [Suillus decipiens]|nr:hypothetical protein BDR04DRAFT_1092622 [Suillus decipiens]
MEVLNAHAPRNEAEQSVTHIAPDDGDQLPFERFVLNRWSGHEHGDPLIDGLQTYLLQPACALPDEYTDGNLMGFPVNNHFHQNLMRNGEHHGPSLLPFSSEWFQHVYESIPGLDLNFHDTEGNQHVHSSLSPANDGQDYTESNDGYHADAMTVWEDAHASANDPHHPAIVSGDVMDSEPVPPMPSCSLRCQHHDIQDQPCGVLIEGEIADILEHFARVHVRPCISADARSDIPSKYWDCRWGGKCDSFILKEGFRRHVLGHLARWKCSTCSSTYSRDDTARKHAKHCKDSRIFMQPQSEVLEFFQLKVPVYLL